MMVSQRSYLLMAVACLGVGAAVSLAPETIADAPRALRSTTVYPPQDIRVKMSHQLPAHARLRCERCHEGATDSQRASDLLLPEEASCNPCHAADTREGQSATSECGLCHEGEPAASTMPTARLHFSHQEHAQSGIGCTDCHGVQDTDLATRQHLPTMRQCLGCHRRESEASAECATCHLTQPDGRLQTRFGDARMLPPRWLHDMDHDRDFYVRHRWVAADQGQECAACHAEDECAECHDGRIRPLSVHPNDFLTTHGPMARRNENRCTSCHTVQRFCTECHSRLGLSPLASAAAAPAGNFHPPGFAGAPHGIEARRSMNTCTSCHAERDCVTCHGAAGVGSGVSPHGPAFVSRCEALLANNERACRTCHGSAALRCP